MIVDATWLVFVAASLVLIVTPGQDMILVMSRSVAQGAGAGVATAAGASVGLLLTKRSALVLGAEAAPRSMRKLFMDGALSNLSNPKIAIFYFAFLPQFVLPAARHPTLTVLALGMAFGALTFLVKGPVGVFAGALSGWLRNHPGVLTWVYRSSGAVLVGLGVRLAFERR